MSPGSLSSPNVLVLPQIRREIANPDNYSDAGGVAATQDGNQIRLDVVTPPRPILTADATYFVRTDGSDANDGMTNDAGGAFLTPQGALNMLSRIDFGGFTVTVDIQPGTYNGTVDVPVMTGQSTPASLLITGSTPGAILTYDSAFGDIIVARAGARARIGAIELAGAVGNVIALHALAGGVLEVIGTTFGVNLFAGIAAEGGIVLMAGDYTITAGGYTHLLIEAGGFYRAVFSGTITLTGTPAFSQFAQCATAAVTRVQGVTFAGGATGLRFNAELNGVIATAGAGAGYLPGDADGTTATGGQYG